MKECFKCREVKPLSCFYKHAQMKDGHVNKCKVCNKNDVAKHRTENIEKIRKYDRDRGSRQPLKYLQDYRKKYPKKYKAHSMMNYQIKVGNIKKMPCTECGEERVCAHHDDYDYPLSVRWLCHAHHSQWHAKNGEALNPF